MINRIFLTLAASAVLATSAQAADSLNASVTGSAGLTALVAGASSYSAPADAWRTVDPENLLIITTKYGDIGVELLPEIAPKHVTQIKTLTRQGFYDDVPFHRVIKGFMNQTGDGSNGDGSGDSALPNIAPEFEFRRSADMHFEAFSDMKDGSSKFGVGFYKSLPIASQPTSQTFWTKDKKVDAFGLHCKGVTSMARTNDPTTANSQFFLMRAKSAHLNKTYSIWGTTVMGFDLVQKPLIGVVGETPGWMPDRMDKVRIAADLPEAERPSVQVLRTDHPAFKAWLNTQKEDGGSLPEICDIFVPTRVQ